MSSPTNPIMEGTQALNTVEPSTADSTQSQIPMPDQSAPTPQAAPQASPDPTQQPAPQSAPRPSLWKGILAGALQGLAAGASVNTRGMSSGGAFAAGAGAGANQILNVVPQQQAALDTQKAQQAYYHANFAKVAYDLHKQQEDDQNADLNQHIADDSQLMKAGALQPVTMPTDSVQAMSQLTAQIQKDPAGQYRVSVTRGSDGEPAYQVVKSLNSPTQADVTVKDRFGKDQVVPAGSVTGAQLEQWRMHEMATGLDLEAEKQDEQRKFNYAKQLDRIKADDKNGPVASLSPDSLGFQPTIPEGGKPADYVRKVNSFKKNADDLSGTEQSYQQFQNVLNDIDAGKDLTGAQSVVALFNAIGISAEPLKGKGFRINQSTVEEHASARGLGESLYQKLLRLKSGDVITPSQIKDYAQIAQSAREQKYITLVNEAHNEGINADFLLPTGNGKSADPSTMRIFLTLANGDQQKAIKALKAKGWN